MKYYIAGFARWVLLLLAVLLFSSCAMESTRRPHLMYELQQEHFERDGLTPLSLEVQNEEVNFSIVFQGGGGENEAARLRIGDRTLQVVLINTDNKAEKMLVLYRFSGTISGLGSGEYLFQIKDSAGRLVAEEKFNIE